MIVTFEAVVDGSPIEIDAIGLPIKVHSGVRCGKCLNRHATAKAVKLCYTRTAELDAQVEAELAAEAALERSLEDRGYWEARAQEDYEERHGVISFADAYREACPWLFGDE